MTRWCMIISVKKASGASTIAETPTTIKACVALELSIHGILTVSPWWLTVTVPFATSKSTKGGFEATLR
ncbi:hypothetical protein OK016_06510 [Vibrio chagasii]|nr:hypothetical protein [Vibrio chagasii]